MKYLYTILVRKAVNFDNLMQDTKKLITRFGTSLVNVKIDKTIELYHNDFEVFKNNLLNDQEFLDGLDQSKNHFILVKEEGTSDNLGIIIHPSGTLYARYSGLIIEEQEMFTCTNCGKSFIGHPAISRKDNKSPVCSECGILEALEVYQLYNSMKDGT